MRRILIYMSIQQHGEYDVFSRPNDRAFAENIKSSCHGVCPNTGNRLWFQGIISAIWNPDVTMEYFSYSMSKEYINQNFDFIVAPMANIVSVGYIALLETLAERFRGIKIPVYVIACGIQASGYDQLAEIVGVLKGPASRFISRVYDTGGEFALRGFFTKEFFDKLGFPSAVVTGCPSLYQLGRELSIDYTLAPREAFRPLFNGSAGNYVHLLKQCPTAVFMDQDVYWRELLDPDFGDNRPSEKDCLRSLINRYGFDVTKYLLEGRIQLIPNANLWREFIRKEQFSLSYGSRIHGNIMPLLAGIPAILEYRDARTLEMAEFFKMPYSIATPRSADALYDLYGSVDYTEFNRGFAKKYDAYEQFLQKCGIVDQINTRNPFFYDLNCASVQSINCETHATLFTKMEQEKVHWKTYSQVLSVKRKIVSALTK